MMEFCLVTLDKHPRVHPIGIGEKLHHVVAKIVMMAAGDQAKTAYDILQLCAGLEAVIDRATHAMVKR